MLTRTSSVWVWRAPPTPGLSRMTSQRWPTSAAAFPMMPWGLVLIGIVVRGGEVKNDFARMLAPSPG